MTDGMTEAARIDTELDVEATQDDENELDPAKWEEHLRARLAETPAVQNFLVPRAYLERALADFEGLRDVARIVDGVGK